MQNNDGDIFLVSFLQWLQAVEESNENLSMTIPKPSVDTVQIMTVHAAKGLEWDIVIVPNLVENTFPCVGKNKSEKISENYSNLMIIFQMIRIG